MTEKNRLIKDNREGRFMQLPKIGDRGLVICHGASPACSIITLGALYSVAEVRDFPTPRYRAEKFADYFDVKRHACPPVVCTAAVRELFGYEKDWEPECISLALSPDPGLAEHWLGDCVGGVARVRLARVAYFC